MAHLSTSQQPKDRGHNLSTADSGANILEDNQSNNDTRYGDFQEYLSQQQKSWLLTRDVELARPLQTKYIAYEADVMAEMRKTDSERERTYNRQWWEMRGTTGLTKMSWKLYRLRARLCSRWDHYQLHCRWKHGRLAAKRKELVDEWVRAQTARRRTLLGEVIFFAGEQAVDNWDDGGFVRDCMLNYIVTGYDSLFPISRELELGVENPWKDNNGGWKALNPFTLWDDPLPQYGWGL
ncbi:hypothetical protein DHEL01_v203271 [Diaporthe helianthi]|uniref:Uncharacterized protein n=1 Tax=Diaporthe helianthi TaxID=158607 RepID=A0A2P5I769_DIAHE|nr:hypothetical protein DHEL01_v203271 [Diaporthe helianthi]